MQFLYVAIKAKRNAHIALALAVSALGLVSAAPASAAEGLGQIGEPWGAVGIGQGQFYNPGMLGVDPETGDVYTGDFGVADKSGFRIQKFTETGTFLASVALPAKEGERLLRATGIALDSAAGRLYVLEGCNVAAGTTTCVAGGEAAAALKILSFETATSGQSLVQTGTFDLPVGGEQIRNATAIAVDPSNHDILVFGENSAKHKVLQRVSSSGAIGARFTDAGNVLAPETIQPARPLVVAPDGTAYTLTGDGATSPGSQAIRAWEIPPTMTEARPVPGFAEAAEAEAWIGFLKTTQTNGSQLSGPLIALSPDGQTLYWQEQQGSAGAPVLIRGFSLTEKETTVLYGGGTTRCRIKTEEVSGLGAVGENMILFEYGPKLANPSPAKPPAYGYRVVRFGPGGTGCPFANPQPPVAKFTINGVENGAIAGERETVVFDASSSELHGGFREELIWRFGDGKQQIVKCPEAGGECAEPAANTVTHRFTAACDCKVELEMKLRNPGAGDPPVVSHKVKIEFRKRLSLTVTKIGAGAGLISSDWSGIYCGEECKGEFEEGKEVTLVPTPAPGSVFAGWSGACAGTALCQVTMSSAKSVTAAFEPAPPPPPAEVVPAQESAAVAPAPTTSPPKSGAKPKLAKVPAACRKLKGKLRARCVKRHRAKSASGHRKHKQRHQGSGKGNR